MKIDWVKEAKKGKGRFAIAEEVHNAIRRDGFVVVVNSSRKEVMVVGKFKRGHIESMVSIEGEPLFVKDEVVL